MPRVDPLLLETPPDLGEALLAALLGRPLGPRLREAVAPLRTATLARAEPKGLWEVFPVLGVSGERALLEGGTELQGPNLARILRGSRRAVAFAATAGPGLDALPAEHRDDPLAGLLLKGIGTALLELVADGLLARIRAEALVEPGWAATCSYAPGEHLWALTEQRVLFALIRPERVGVTLTPECLMVPTLSVSGILGLGPGGEIDRTLSACQLCPRPRCFARRDPYTAEGQRRPR